MKTKAAAPARAATFKETSSTDSTAIARAYHFLLTRCRGFDPVTAAAMAPDMAVEAARMRRAMDRERGTDHMIRQRPHQLSRGGGQQTQCDCGQWVNPESLISVARHRLCSTDLAASA